MSSHESLFQQYPVINGQFRLLDILPVPVHEVEESGPIRCELRIASLYHPPKYEAISYVWGSQGPENEVVIDVSGQRFKTTRNLYAAIVQFRLPEKRRTVWAD